VPDLFRQQIYSRLAGYEDTNDAERLAEDPAFRMLASRERRETSVALTSTLHWFETDVLAEEQKYQGLNRLNTELVQHLATRSPRRWVLLDIDSSESPVHGAQEQSAYNGQFESVGYHQLFVFNVEGDCLAAKLRPGNVHSAGGRTRSFCPSLPRGALRDPAAVQRCAGAADRGSAYPASRPTEPRAAGPLSEFRASSRLLRRLALPRPIQSWFLTSLQQRLFKTGGRLIREMPGISFFSWPKAS